VGEDHRRPPESGAEGPVPQWAAANYGRDTLRQAVDAAHAVGRGSRVALHSNLPDSGLAEIGAEIPRPAGGPTNCVSDCATCSPTLSPAACG